MYRARLNEKVFTALGAASACWDDLEGAGVFQSEKCKLIGEALIADIDQMYHEWHQEWLRNDTAKREAEAAYAEASPVEPFAGEEPMLGLATTAQLLDEVRTRLEVGHGDLHYRTVGGESDMTSENQMATYQGSDDDLAESSDDAAHWSPELLDDSDVEISPAMVRRMAALDRAKDLLKGMTRTGIGTGAVGPGPKELITLAEWILNDGADDGQPGSVD